MGAALVSGDRVNLETDILGKYILRFLDRGQGSRGMSWDDLRRAGFAAGGTEGAGS